MSLQRVFGVGIIVDLIVAFVERRSFLRVMDGWELKVVIWVVVLLGPAGVFIPELVVEWTR